VGSVLLAVTTFGTVLLLALRPIPHSLEQTASVSLEDKTEAVGTKCVTKCFAKSKFNKYQKYNFSISAETEFFIQFIRENTAPIPSEK
jgi:hypothetical protein